MASIQTAIQLVDRVSGPVQQILASVNRTITAFEEMQRASAAPIDMGWIDGARQDINEATAGIRMLQEEIENVAIPVEWNNSGNLEVFMNSGVERFRQEIQAASSALNTMTASQSNVIRMAQRMEIPPGMMNDLVGMNARIRTIQTAITQLEANPIDNTGADAVNNQLEQMRGQLAQALNAQNQMTEAMGRGDISAALTQYNQLNGIVSRTERQVRDNVNEQKNFNQEVRNVGRESESLLERLSRGVTVPDVGTAAKSLFTGMFEAAAELETTEAKYNTAFAGMQTRADQFIQEFQKLMPATTAEARSMASGIQDLLVPMGMQRGAAAEMTGDMMHLIGALTNFNSATKSMEEVAGTFSGALTGEYESLKSLGIHMNDTIVKQKAVSMGLAESEKNVGAAAKAQAMYALACEQSRDALAAYNEESLNTTTRLGLLKVGFQESLGGAGQVFLPKMNELLQKVQERMPVIEQALLAVAGAFGIVVDAASWLFDSVMDIGQWVEDNWNTIEPILLGVAAALGVVALAAGIHTAVITLQTAATWLSVAANRALVATMLKNPVIWIALAIGILVAVIYKWVQSVGGIKIAWLIAMDKIQTAWDWVKIGLTTGIYWVMNQFNKFQLTFMTVCTNFQNWAGDMRAGILTILQGMVNGAIDIINNFINLLNNIPGVSIKAINHVTFGAEYAAANEAEKAARNAALADYRSKIEQQISDRAADLEQRKADARAATEKRQQEILQAREELAKKQAETEKEQPEALPDPYTSTIASDVGSMKDSMELSQEDLKYLREIADRESINRFTTAEIKVDMQNTNQLSSNMDIDGFLNHFGERMEETLSSVAIATARG